MRKNSFLLFIVMLSVCSCSRDFDTPKELIDYAADEDNGYRYTKTTNGVDYQLQYRPTDMMASQELGNQVSEASIDSLRKTYRQYMYFTLSMSKNNRELLTGVAQDKNKFGQLVNNLAFDLDKKIHLFTQQNDTIKMVDFVYPRMYDMTNNTSVLVIFERNQQKLESDFLNFTIEDLGFMTGEVSFKIKSKKLVNEPELNLN